MSSIMKQERFGAKCAIKTLHFARINIGAVGALCENNWTINEKETLEYCLGSQRLKHLRLFGTMQIFV